MGAIGRPFDESDTAAGVQADAVHRSKTFWTGKRKPMNFRIVIFTRDSARWIGIIARAYRRLGLRPLYLVHDKTTDATSSILRELGEDARPISFPKNFVESGLSQLPDFVQEEWVLRMDDDEFPSRRMIDFTNRAVKRTREQAIAYARLGAAPDSFPLQSATQEELFDQLAPFHHDPQVRAFRHRDVVYKDDIHTPGFVLESVRIAPSNAYLVHFHNIVRSPAEVIAKFVRYEIEKPGSGTYCCGATVTTRKFETREFDALARELGAIEHPIVEMKGVDPEIEQRIRNALSQQSPMSRNEEKLARIRERIEAVPKPLRGFFKLM